MSKFKDPEAEMKRKLIIIITARCYRLARGMLCQDVRLSHAGIVSKRLNLSSYFFHHRVATTVWFSAPNVMAILRRGPPNGGVKYKGV